MEITAPGLLLRPWRAADAPAVLAALVDPDIVRWNGQGVADLAQAAAWIARRADRSDGSHVSLAVTGDADGALLGAVSVHQIRDGNAAVGYWTAAPSRGRGVAGRALAALTGWAFARLDLHRIELWHAVDNPASCRVAARAGYRLEGTLRESHRYGDGRRHDEHLHARLTTDS
ncbi:Protein N-acetyltransferase, RimJ/RimL family [Micromonospora matsumotoense]|uniref:Protein N-acetyltransferase, RimJ/RimL family n=1 Tax=Micromonospora matsumotoense TaxID=121616 RepID=A0A1C4YTJ5_9ACTN|nr:Protein N-acetyltransferase, RimJ/RimL family [Micromonospora matsumotoense]